MTKQPILDSKSIYINYTEKSHFSEPSSDGSTLYVVATPIGNLEDITLRAIKILNQVDLIAAEDTRHTAKLLAHYQIQTPLISCHEHNEESRIDTFVQKLSDGFNIALVSDAGTPLISDPGYRVVKGVCDAGFKVIPIPGACAAIAGLSVSGLPTDSFIFAGFPSRKKGKRISELEELLKTLKGKSSTIIFYESPHRIVKLIEDILEVMGDRPAMVGREITKHYEEYLRGTLSDILIDLKSRAAIKGECALFVGSNNHDSNNHEIEKSDNRNKIELTNGEAHSDISNADFNLNCHSNHLYTPNHLYNEIDHEILNELESSKIKTSALAKLIAKKHNLPKQDIYSRILQLQQKE